MSIEQRLYRILTIQDKVVNSILNTVQLLLVDTLIAMRMNLLLENNPCPAMIKAVKKIRVEVIHISVSCDEWNRCTVCTEAKKDSSIKKKREDV